MENQRRVMVLEEFLHTALLYQVTNIKNIHVLAVKQYLVFAKREQWGALYCIINTGQAAKVIRPGD